MAIAASAAASAQQIRFAEPVQMALGGSAAEFDAYGRRFSLNLVNNERALALLPAQRKQQLQNYRLVRGSLEGQPGSWVRLTESATGVDGAIWDGHDLYVVTNYASIEPLLTTPFPAAPNQTVVYRLADARDLLPQDFCAVGGDALRMQKQTPLDQYRTLVGELQSVAAATLTRQIEIALIADSAFAASESADPTAAMLARLNIVEGIFSEQVGLLVMATDVRVMPAGNDPFTSTKPSTLLDQLGKYRSQTAAVRARGLAHLMTGKNLDGTTVGIAYVNSACSADRGVSLSERSYNTTISALIMAHELGHNFGAPHDGEAGEACAAVAGGYLMSPSVSGFATFSQCSLNVMRSALDAASCVTPANYADAALFTPVNSLNVDGGVPFALPFTVSSAGTNSADGVVFSAVLPEGAGVSFESASAESGSCSVSRLTAACNFGSLPASEQRAVAITARGTLAGSVAVRANVSASNDRLTSNNSREVAVSIRSGIDAALAVNTNAPEVMLGEPIEIYADLRSLRALPVRNAVLSLNLNQAVSSAGMPGATCVANQFSVICNVAEVPAGGSLRLTVTANTAVAGPLLANGSVTASGDGDITNNSASASAWVQAERDIEVTAGAASVDLAVGGAYEIPIQVRARGPQSTGAVTLRISIPSSAVAVDLLDAGGSPCIQADAWNWHCDLGAVLPGTSRLVRLRVRGAGTGSVQVGAFAETVNDDYGANNSAGVQFRVDNPVDLALVVASGGVGLEDEDFLGQVSLYSGGRQAASDATLDIDLNAAGVLRGAAIASGAACVLVTPQRATCALPVMPRGTQLFVSYTAQFTEPGNYDVTFTLRTPGDTAAENDVLTRPIVVRPFNDIAVSGTLDLTQMLVGQTRETTFHVSTARRDLHAARFSARHVLPAVAVTTIRADQGECRIDPEAGAICDFTDLAAYSAFDVTVGWRAEDAADADVRVDVSTLGDVAAGNDKIIGRAEVFGATDLELQVGTGMSGSVGAAVEFPAISVINGSARAHGTRLEVVLPAGVSLVGISAANAICSGASVLRCDFDDLEANSTSTVNLSVRAAALGSYVSSLKLSALNDTNPSNDAREVSLQISGGASVSEAKSGGGGSMEWLGLLPLLALVTRKWGQTPFPSKRGQG